MTLCSKCGKGLTEGSMVQATVFTIYHEIPKPEMDQLRFALERPHAFSNVQHMCCEE